MRTLRTNGEEGEKMSFMEVSLMTFETRNSVIPRSRALARRLEGWPRVPCGRSFEARRKLRRAPQDDGVARDTSLSRDDLLPLLAKSLDAERHHVADIEE